MDLLFMAYAPGLIILVVGAIYLRFFGGMHPVRQKEPDPDTSVA